MTAVLNALASAAFYSRRNKWINLATIGLLILSVLMIALAKPENFIDTTIYDYTAKSTPTGLLNRYVRVKGVLLLSQTIQGQASTGNTQITGSRYVPLMIEGSSEPLFVIEKNLPAIKEGEPIELIGLIEGRAGFPSVYLFVSQPPDIPLQNRLARVGVVVSILVLMWWLLGAWLSRANFAPSVTSAGSTRDTGLLWFGSLGSEFGNAQIREAAIHLNKSSREMQLDSASNSEQWRIHVRKVRRAQPTNVATSRGALPAVRIEFEDERGQVRNGTVAAGDASLRDDFLSALNT